MADELRFKLIASKNSFLTRFLNWTLLGSFAGVVVGIVVAQFNETPQFLTGIMVILFVGTGLFRVLRSTVVSNQEIVGELVFGEKAIDIYSFEEVITYPLGEIENLNIIFNGHDLEENPIVQLGEGLRKMKQGITEINWLLLKVNGRAYKHQFYIPTPEETEQFFGYLKNLEERGMPLDFVNRHGSNAIYRKYG